MLSSLVHVKVRYQSVALSVEVYKKQLHMVLSFSYNKEKTYLSDKADCVLVSLVALLLFVLVDFSMLYALSNYRINFQHIMIHAVLYC